MTKIIVEFDDAQLLRALMESGAQRISLDSFISQALDAALENPNPVSQEPPVNVDDLIASALDRVHAIERGKEFFLSDVCADAAWQTLTGGERKSLGKMFRKAVECNTPPLAKYVRRASNNTAVYVRL
jgi:hypothetical protein